MGKIAPLYSQMIFRSHNDSSRRTHYLSSGDNDVTLIDLVQKPPSKLRTFLRSRLNVTLKINLVSTTKLLGPAALTVTSNGLKSSGIQISIEVDNKWNST